VAAAASLRARARVGAKRESESPREVGGGNIFGKRMQKDGCDDVDGTPK